MYEFFLMHARTDRAMRTAVAKELEKSSLTMTEWLALGVIAASPKEGIRMSKIAQELDVTLPQVTAVVISLLDKKLCKQRVFAGDRRGRLVLATLKGKRLLVRLEISTNKTIQKLSSSIESERLQIYTETLGQLSEQVDHPREG